MEIARGRGVHNQIERNQTMLSWMNLKFRSKSEVRVAQALDKEAVLFIPNCAARQKNSGTKYNTTSRAVISKDGKTMTVTVRGTGTDGSRVSNTMVYDKQ